MSLRSLVPVAIGACVLAACDAGEQSTSASTTLDAKLAPPVGFVTSQPAQARALSPSATLKPIITVGDPIPGQQGQTDPELRVYAPYPDGLGAYQDGGDLVVFTAHENARGGSSSADGTNRFRYARISRLVLDAGSLGVKGGSYPVHPGMGGPFAQLERFCSATFAGAAENFAPGWFFTGEEQRNSTSTTVAVSQDGSQAKVLPWLGRYAHENTISVPGFDGGKVVMIGLDDAGWQSELYMYVGNSAADVLGGSGTLYVFKATSTGAPAGSALMSVGQGITGDFVEVANPEQSWDALNASVKALGAFPFVRLEDGDYDKRTGVPGQKPAIYFVDTGRESSPSSPNPNYDLGLCGGSCDRHGSIFRMDFDPANPTAGARLTLLAKSAGAESGWASPDNIATSRKSLMLQEDPAYPGFKRAPRIWQLNILGNAGLGAAKPVVEVDNAACDDGSSDPAATCWESSGIIDASEWLGAGTWLFDVQAHGAPFGYAGTQVFEGGQLLYLRQPGS
jgi:hypothetical protein